MGTQGNNKIGTQRDRGEERDPVNDIDRCKKNEMRINNDVFFVARNISRKDLSIRPSDRQFSYKYKVSLKENRTKKHHNRTFTESGANNFQKI